MRYIILPRSGGPATQGGRGARGERRSETRPFFSGAKMTNIVKHIAGTVVQIFDQETGKCVSQVFEPASFTGIIDGEEAKYKHPIELTQPPNPRVAKVLITNASDRVKDEAARNDLNLFKACPVVLDIGEPYQLEILKYLSADLSAIVAEGMTHECSHLLLY